MHPLCSSTISASSVMSLLPLISSASRFTSPISFTITAMRSRRASGRVLFSRRMRFSRVVLPAPRKPESTLTFIGAPPEDII